MISPPPSGVRPDKNVLATTQLPGGTAPPHHHQVKPPSHYSHPPFTFFYRSEVMQIWLKHWNKKMLGCQRVRVMENMERCRWCWRAVRPCLHRPSDPLKIPKIFQPTKILPHSTSKLTLFVRGTFSALVQSSLVPGDTPPALCSIFSPF